MELLLRFLKDNQALFVAPITFIAIFLIIMCQFTNKMCTFADASAYCGNDVPCGGRSQWGGAQLCGKATLYALFLDYLNVGNSSYWTKTNAEVTPTDVYIYAAGVCRGYCALTHTFGCICIYSCVGISLSVLSIGQSDGLSSGTGSRRYPRFFCFVET